MGSLDAALAATGDPGGNFVGDAMGMTGETGTFGEFLSRRPEGGGRSRVRRRSPSSGIGVIYYWINASGPRIYTDPVPVHYRDTVSYWAIDRASNLEWRRTTDVRGGPQTDQASKPQGPQRSS